MFTDETSQPACLLRQHPQKSGQRRVQTKASVLGDTRWQHCWRHERTSFKHSWGPVLGAACGLTRVLTGAVTPCRPSGLPGSLNQPLPRVPPCPVGAPHSAGHPGPYRLRPGRCLLLPPAPVSPQGGVLTWKRGRARPPAWEVPGTGHIYTECTVIALLTCRVSSSLRVPEGRTASTLIHAGEQVENGNKGR